MRARDEAVATVASLLDDQLVVTANGHIAREVQAGGDRPENFYMVGSMGLASTIGLGMALGRPDRRVVIFDGDGNVLMGLGHLAMVAERAPINVCHLVFDNGSYASTGGQRAISDTVALEGMAAAAGYRHAERVGPDDDLATAARRVLDLDGPSLLVIPVAPGNRPGVPRIRPTPPQITSRVRSRAMGSAPGAVS